MDDEEKKVELMKWQIRLGAFSAFLDAEFPEKDSLAFNLTDVFYGIESIIRGMEKKNEKD